MSAEGEPELDDQGRVTFDVGEIVNRNDSDRKNLDKFFQTQYYRVSAPLMNEDLKNYFTPQTADKSGYYIARTIGSEDTLLTPAQINTKAYQASLTVEQETSAAADLGSAAPPAPFQVKIEPVPGSVPDTIGFDGVSSSVSNSVNTKDGKGQLVVVVACVCVAGLALYWSLQKKPKQSSFVD